MQKVVVAIIVLLVILVLLWGGVEALAAAGPAPELVVHDFAGPVTGPYIVLVGGAHGNEPAGTAGLMSLVGEWQRTGWRPRAGLIRVIPCMNPWGMRKGVRWQNSLLHPDLNRNFRPEGGVDTNSKRVLELILERGQPTLIVDFHEGWGYHRRQPGSVGSTLSPTLGAEELANRVVAALNTSIDEPVKKFMTLRNRPCVIQNTLACWASHNNLHYILVETTGQGNVQPLNLRMEQVRTIVAGVTSAIMPADLNTSR